LSVDGWRFTFRDRIRYGDLDTNAHLNNVAVHQFFESARVGYMRGLFPEIDPMGRAGGFGMIFAETHVRFASPGFYEEDLRVDVKPDELRRSSVKIAFRMVCEGDGRLVAEGWGTLVGYDYEHNRAAPFPEPIARRLRDEL
jgi:acyl-CoA thioester hydrolase